MNISNGTQNRKEERMDVNTTSQNPTHFLRGVELVQQAQKKYKIPSENWPYPTSYRFGFPQDHYYAEVWHNGMDYSSNYWVIEEVYSEEPNIQPLMIFEIYEQREKFNDYDFKEFVMGCLYFRRDILWIRSGDYGVYTDLTWPFYYTSVETKYGCMNKSFFEHASQSLVRFWMNHNFIPREHWRILVDEENRNCGNQTSFHGVGSKCN